MSEDQVKDLQRLLDQEQHRSQAHQAVHKITNICWDKVSCCCCCWGWCQLGGVVVGSDRVAHTLNYTYPHR